MTEKVKTPNSKCNTCNTPKSSIDGSFTENRNYFATVNATFQTVALPHFATAKS